MTAVATIAGHIGTTSWNTSTSAQASAMKMAAKMYFSIASPQRFSSSTRVGQIGDLAVERDAQADEDRDGDREDAQRDPEEGVLLALARTSGSSGGSPAGDSTSGDLDVPLDLGAERVDEAHQLEVAAADAVLALEPEQQALVVDAQHVGAPRVAPDARRGA